MRSTADTSSQALAKIPPQTPGGFRLKTLNKLRQRGHIILCQHAKTFGDIFVLRVGFHNLYILNHPQYIAHVLQDNYKNYTKRTRGWNGLRPLFGEGLLTSDGNKWFQQRKTMQPAFHLKRIQGFFDVFKNKTSDILESWNASAKTGKPLNIAEEMMALTFRIVTATLFSEDATGKEHTVGKALTNILQYAAANYVRLWKPPLWVPTPANQKVLNSIKELDHIVYAIIRERRKGDKKCHDLLSMLMEAKNPDTGKGMSDKELRDQVMTIFMTGHETTAVALTWSWYLLSQNPDIERRFSKEVEEVLAGRGPELSDLPHLKLTKKIFQETLRLYPPIWVFSRQSIDSDQIGPYQIPANSTVVFSPYVMHRNPKYFQNPDVFDPDRFAAHPEDSLPPFAYFPFGGGPRLCIGRNFALMEASVILPLLAQQFRLELFPGHNVDADSGITLRPRHGMLMTLRPK